MFNYKQKKKAIDLYYKYNKHIAPVVHKLDYPSENALRQWIREYEKTGKISSKHKRNPSFSKQQIDEAINYYYDHGENVETIANEYNVTIRWYAREWYKVRGIKY